MINGLELGENEKWMWSTSSTSELRQDVQQMANPNAADQENPGVVDLGQLESRETTHLPLLLPRLLHPINSIN